MAIFRSDWLRRKNGEQNCCGAFFAQPKNREQEAATALSPLVITEGVGCSRRELIRFLAKIGGGVFSSFSFIASRQFVPLLLVLPPSFPLVLFLLLRYCSNVFWLEDGADRTCGYGKIKG